MQENVDAYVAYHRYRRIEDIIRKAFQSEVTMLSISSYTGNAIRRYSPKAKITRVGSFVRDEFCEIPYVRPSRRARVLSAIARAEPLKGFDVFVRASESYGRGGEISG